MKKAIYSLILIVAVFSSQSALGWNSTGHQLVARIAWDNMTDTAKENVINLLMQTPSDACFPTLATDARPLKVRQRELFMVAATWPDIIRPNNKNGHTDTRPCIKLHQRDWHFVDHFWSGISGDPNSPPHDEPIPIELVNAVERLQTFRPSVVSNLPPTERAMKLAWILHLVGDIHQPLHASGHVTALPNEKKGDAGGNTFALGPKLSLHSYWDGIVDRADPQKPNESLPNYFDRVANEFETAKPKSTFTILPGKFDKWALESLERAKNKAYPKSLQRNVMPGTTYQQSTFLVAQESIAEGGYRLADLMNQLFGH